MIYKDVGVNNSFVFFGSDVQIDTNVDYLDKVFYLNYKNVIIYSKNTTYYIRIYDGNLGDAFTIPSDYIIPVSNSQLYCSYYDYNTSATYLLSIYINGYNIEISDPIFLFNGKKYLWLQLSDKYFLFYQYYSSYELIIAKIDLTIPKITKKDLTLNGLNPNYIFNNLLIAKYNSECYICEFNQKYDGYVLNMYQNKASFIKFSPNLIIPKLLDAEYIYIYINYGILDNEPALPAYNSTIPPKNYLLGKSIDNNRMRLLCIDF